MIFVVFAKTQFLCGNGFSYIINNLQLIIIIAASLFILEFVFSSYIINILIDNTDLITDYRDMTIKKVVLLDCNARFITVSFQTLTCYRGQNSTRVTSHLLQEKPKYILSNAVFNISNVNIFIFCHF